MAATVTVSFCPTVGVRPALPRDSRVYPARSEVYRHRLPVRLTRLALIVGLDARHPTAGSIKDVSCVWRSAAKAVPVRCGCTTKDQCAVMRSNARRLDGCAGGGVAASRGGRPTEGKNKTTGLLDEALACGSVGHDAALEQRATVARTAGPDPPLVHPQGVVTRRGPCLLADIREHVHEAHEFA